jgi:hypothetical protein
VNLEIGWEAMIAILAGLLVLLFLVVLFVAREQRSRRVRVGFFVERELGDDHDSEPSS